MRFQKTITGFVFACWPLASLAAQTQAAEASTPVPAPRYESAFAGYRAYQEPQPGAWRERNDEVGQVGGHAGHMKRPDASPKPSNGDAGHKH